jgi:hypothetical protein
MDFPSLPGALQVLPVMFFLRRICNFTLRSSRCCYVDLAIDAL